MPKERFYHPQQFHLNDSISIEGPECHHLATVMRLKPGDRVELINGLGALAQAQIIELEKKRGVLQIEQLQIGEKRKSKLILAQAIPKPNRLDFVIEKGTELGMDALWLFPGQLSEKKELTKNQLERLDHLAIAAMKQCGRLFLPEIALLPPLSKWPPQIDSLYYGSLDPHAPLLIDRMKNHGTGTAIFCVGPESGFSKEEEAILKGLNAVGVKLNSNILRTETAAIAALAIMSHLLP